MTSLTSTGRRVEACPCKGHYAAHFPKPAGERTSRRARLRRYPHPHLHNSLVIARGVASHHRLFTSMQTDRVALFMSATSVSAVGASPATLPRSHPGSTYMSVPILRGQPAVRSGARRWLGHVVIMGLVHVFAGMSLAPKDLAGRAMGLYNAVVACRTLLTA